MRYEGNEEMFDKSMIEGKCYIIPQEESTKLSLLNVDRSTKEEAIKRHRIYIDTDWECNTIATSVILNLLKMLYSNITSDINMMDVFHKENSSVQSLIKTSFFDLFDMDVTNKVNENADKEGNVNIAFYPGAAAERIISDDTPPQDRKYEFIQCKALYGENKNEAYQKVIEKLDKLARQECAKKYGIILPAEYIAIAITVIFMENIYRELAQQIVITGKKTVTINFNKTLIFSAMRKKDKVEIYIKPGSKSKLRIKSDETTEQDNSSYDDDLL